MNRLNEALKRYQTKGSDSLSVLEMITILAGDSTLAVALFDRFHTIEAMSSADVVELMEVDGIGKATATKIKVAFDLGGRVKRAQLKSVAGSQAAAQHFMDIANGDIENFKVLLLNRNNRIIHQEILHKGGMTMTVVDPRVVLRKALIYKAASIIVGHNHPSGNLSPSTADRQITSKLQEGAKLMDIQLLDHIIVTPQEDYYSFADEGIM